MFDHIEEDEEYIQIMSDEDDEDENLPIISLYANKEGDIGYSSVLPNKLEIARLLTRVSAYILENEVYGRDT